MTIDPQVLRAEQHVEIGRVLQRDADALIERWSHRAAQEQPNAARVHGPALKDHLPKFLQALGHALADSISPTACPHCVPAGEHGEQRWEVGWSLAEVVRDYQILRLVVFEHLEKEVGCTLVAHEVQAVGLAFDEAIAASIAAYVHHRDKAARAAEQTLREQAEALRDADRRKNEFLAVLAHELRNPLAPILTSVEVLRLLGPAAPDVVQARDIVERQVKHMVRLVDDLLDVTRIAQGKLALRKAPFDLAAAVAEAVQTIAPLYEAQGHRLSVELPAEPLTLEADQARVVQVLVNLLANAGKYTDRGGRITLTAARDGGGVVLSVRDNGVGIAPDMLGRVFDLFTQADGSLGRARGGLGIGLTLVRRLVELHGGAVEARSEGPGRGSEFVVRLPGLAPPPAAAPATPAAAPAAPPVKPLSILIVEDNADARRTLAALLGLMGHGVEAAATGTEGVARAAELRPRVALIDLGLPGLDGYEVGRRLRAALGGSAVLIALSGYAGEEDRRRALAAGFDAHLAKPVDLDELKKILDDAAK
jgi:signal transduction histidine kinase/CheY-like chemotaxis protein